VQPPAPTVGLLYCTLTMLLFTSNFAVNSSCIQTIRLRCEDVSAASVFQVYFAHLKKYWEKPCDTSIYSFRIQLDINQRSQFFEFINSTQNLGRKFRRRSVFAVV
jgi:hypothetical protein